MFDEVEAEREHHLFLSRMYILNQVVAVVIEKKDTVPGIHPDRLRAMVANYKKNGNPYNEE